MNCQNCGAENEAAARFCAECGAPLESQVHGSHPLEDDDQTILSMPSQIAEQAKTMAVTEEDIATAAAEAEPAPPSEPEPDSSSPPPGSPPGGNGVSDGGFWSQRNIIIAVVALLLLCCCCSAVVIAGLATSEEFINIINELGVVSSYLYFA